MTRRIKRISGETFKVTERSLAEIDMAENHHRDVIAVLGSQLSDSRRAVIEKVLASRTRTVQIAIEGLADPHNTAAIVRTAEAFGIQDVHIIHGIRSFKSSSTVTQGTHKWMDIHLWDRADAFAAFMREKGRKILVASMEGAIELETMVVTEPMVLVFGNESEGISETMRCLADGAFRVPMYGFVESLNVSVAAAISIASIRRGGLGDLSVHEQNVLRARFYMKAVRAGFDIVVRARGAAIEH